MAQKPNNTYYRTFAEIDSILTSIDYVEVTTPSSFIVPSAFTGSYNVHYYVQNITNDIVAVIAYPSEDDIPSETCGKKATSIPDTEHPGKTVVTCTEAGSECKVEIKLDDNGNPTYDFKIICCGG